MIRPLRPGDETAVAALERLSFPDPWKEEDILASARSSLSLSFVALDGEEIVGYLLGSLIPPEGELLRIATDKRFRRRGIGRSLLCAAVRAGKERGMDCFLLEVRHSNAAAATLYESVGFEVIGRRKDYYRLPIEDAIIYRLDCKNVKES